MMFLGAVGRRSVRPLYTSRHIACCCSQHTRGVLQPGRQLHASSTLKGVLAPPLVPSTVYSQLVQGSLQHRPTWQPFAYSTGTAAEVQHQDDEVDAVKGSVHEVEYDEAYVNFFALTGVLDRDMSTYQKPNGDFTFKIRVYPHEQQQSVMFEVEARNEVAAEIRNQLNKLPEGALLSITGELARPQEAYGKLKAVATTVGICTNVPDHIATARANHQAWRDAGREERTSAPAVSNTALTPGTGGMPLEASNDHEAIWMELFTNPASYYDKRLTKTGRQPDFKCKTDSNKALWIDDRRTPRWVMDNLQLLPGNLSYTPSQVPSSGGSYTPSQPGMNKFAFMPSHASSDREGLWMELFNNYDRWWDNRTDKQLNPKRPDFRKKGNGDKALWIDGLGTPQWVTDNIDSAFPSPPN